jgi:hypothetical protein
MPHHRLHVNKGAVYRLLWNFSINRGLVKNIHIVITGLGHKLITIRILKHNNQLPSSDDWEILLLCITFKDTLPSSHTLLWWQFPLALTYTTTFHSCQGLTLNKVGIDLSTPLFTHGQLYTALLLDMVIPQLILLFVHSILYFMVSFISIWYYMIISISYILFTFMVLHLCGTMCLVSVCHHRPW